MLAFLGMELGADHIISSNNGRNRPAMIGRCQNFGRVSRIQLIGVDEIGVGAVFYPG